MIKLTLDELRSMVEHLENESKYHNMKPYVLVSFSSHGITKSIQFEQPCDYYDCNSNYYRYRITDGKQYSD